MNVREIKFRGKQIDGKEWEYGFLSVGSYEVSGKRRHGYVIDSTDGAGLVFRVPVDPATVGQFTGQKDKNGNEIYEGDILHLRCVLPNKEVWEQNNLVVFSNGAFRTCLDGEEHDTGGLLEETLDTDGGMKVIGNIHDNPE